MKKFFQKLSNMISENYEHIFHQEFRHLYKTQYTQYDDIYLLSFGFLKLIDSALKFSKNDIINEYKQSKDDENIVNKLFNKAKYPNGELLGFYNYSNYDLEKLSTSKTNIYNNFKEYINSFDENTQKVFENYEFDTIIEFLHVNDLLFDLLKNLNNLDLKDYKTRNFKNMQSSYESFLNEFYIWKDLRNEALSGINAENFIPHSLIKILLEDVNLKKKKQIKIFDPFCRDGFLLFETKRLIQEINPNCNVEIFGKEEDISQYAICLSKMIIDKQNPSNILKVYDLKSQLLELNENIKFDLIISNFGIKDISLSYDDRMQLFNRDPLEYFVEKLNNSGKLVSTASFDTLTKNHHMIFEMIYNDFLELITRIDISGTDSDLVILSINKNKHKKRKNRFLLIDGNEVMTEIRNVHCINITQPLLEKIVNHYFKFKENNNIHLIRNSSFITKEYKDMVNKSFEKASLMTKDMNIFDSPFNETISSIVDEIGDYYFENCKVQFNFNRLIHGEKDETESDGTPIYYLGELVDLVNDPNPSTNEELAEIFLIPLNKNEHSFENPFFYQSELRGYNQHNMIPFEINTDKISKDFLLYYLNSNKGKLELKECSKGSNIINKSDLRFIQVPVPSLERQREIIGAVEKTKEFFDSVNLLKNNFQNNILNYERVLEDIEEFQGEIEFSQEEYKFTKMDRNWRHVYEGLPWPLAITYLSATRGGFETVQKANAYLKLFEFVTLFNSIVLISAIPEDYYEENKNTFIWTKHDNFYSFMTFGKWLKLYEFLRNIYSAHEFNPIIESELFEQLCSKKIFNSLNIAKNARNEDAHGPITNEFEAEEVINHLKPLLYDTFDSLTSYSDFKLYYIIGKFERTENGSLKQDVIMLNGPCAQPIYRELIYDKELDAYSLYLFNPLNEELLKINDKLMKFKQTDRIKNQWALFIYSGWEHAENSNQAIYKCYQQTEKDFVVPIESFSNDIK